jgi:hypothetical protein
MSILKCIDGIFINDRNLEDAFEYSVNLTIEDMNNIVNKRITPEIAIDYIKKLKAEKDENSLDFLVEQIFDSLELTWQGFELYNSEKSMLIFSLQNIIKIYYYDTIECLENYECALKKYNKLKSLVKYNFYSLILNVIATKKYKNRNIEQKIINNLIYERLLSYNVFENVTQNKSENASENPSRKAAICNFVRMNEKIFFVQDKNIPYLLRKDSIQNFNSLCFSIESFMEYMSYF